MTNKDKIEEIYNIIKENRIFNDNELIEVLLLLNPQEYDYFVEYVTINKNDDKLSKKLFKIKAKLELARIDKIEDITNSSGYKFYIECLNKGDISTFLTQAKEETLADIKTLMNMTTSKSNAFTLSVVSELISEIEDEVSSRDKERKKKFQNNPMFCL